MNTLPREELPSKGEPVSEPNRLNLSLIADEQEKFEGTGFDNPPHVQVADGAALVDNQQVAAMGMRKVLSNRHEHAAVVSDLPAQAVDGRVGVCYRHLAEAPQKRAHVVHHSCLPGARRPVDERRPRIGEDSPQRVNLSWVVDGSLILSQPRIAHRGISPDSSIG